MGKRSLTLVLIGSFVFLAGCAVLSTGEQVDVDTIVALQVGVEFEQHQTRATGPFPPEVTEALSECVQRVDLLDLRLGVGEEGRLRRCLRAEQRGFMGATSLIVDWQVNWLRQRLAEHRARGGTRLAEQTLWAGPLRD